MGCVPEACARAAVTRTNNSVKSVRKLCAREEGSQVELRDAGQQPPHLGGVVCAQRVPIHPQRAQRRQPTAAAAAAAGGGSGGGGGELAGGGAADAVEVEVEGAEEREGGEAERERQRAAVAQRVAAATNAIIFICKIRRIYIYI